MAGGSCDLPPAGAGAWRGPTDNRERHTARRYRLLPRRGPFQAAPPLKGRGIIAGRSSRRKRTANNITLGQAAIAREQERLFFQGELSRKNDAIAEQRERALMLEGRLMQAENAREADRRQMETMGAMHAQFAALSSRVAGIECNMVKAPQFYPYGGIASVNLCGYQPCHTATGGCGTCA